MKRVLFLLLLIVAVPMSGVDRDRTPVPTLIDDVIRMSKAGVDDEAIIEFVRKSDERIEVTADDLIALTDGEVSKDVIKAVIDTADERDGGRRSSSRGRVIAGPVYAPYWSWGDPLWDPYWYGPRLSIGIGFGGRHRYPYYGGHFHRGGGGHRRHR